MEKPNNKNKITSWIPDTVESRIVELSLQNPEFGVTRLLRLLKQEDTDISVSSINSVLKRHGLQNREMRFARVKVKQAADEVRARTAKPSTALRSHEEKILPAAVLPVNRLPAEIRIRRSWGQTAFNTLLLILIVLSGFYAVQITRSAILKPKSVVETDPAPIETIPGEAEVDALILNDYHFIWERDLFDISEKNVSAPEKEIATKDIAVAQKDLGLKLVGTVVSDDPSLNRAMIDNLITHAQGIYSVGNRIGPILIKQILNDRIIIDAGRGDEVLAMSRPLITATQLEADNQPVAQPAGARHRKGFRHRTATLSREAVVAALSDIDRTLDNVYISSGMPFNNPPGFRITSFERGSIFAQLGLRNGDRVLSVNDQNMNSAEQAKDFIRKIREGGNLDIKVKRRARTRHIHINIQ